MFHMFLSKLAVLLGIDFSFLMIYQFSDITMVHLFKDSTWSALFIFWVRFQGFRNVSVRLSPDKGP